MKKPTLILTPKKTTKPTMILTPKVSARPGHINPQQVGTKGSKNTKKA